MKRVVTLLRLLALGFSLCDQSIAVTEYVIANNGNYISNNAILYRLNTKTGKLAKTAVLRTGGEGVIAKAYVGQVEQAVSAGAGCIFVLDDGSSDIAAFSKATSYHRVGKYFDANLIAGTYGGSLALAPGDKFLYAGYAESSNIGVWRVKSDCTLALMGSYIDAAGPGPIGVTPNGKYLVASSAGVGAGLFEIDQNDGSLTAIGIISFNGGVCARVGSCTPLGLDITKDSALVVFASSSVDVTHQHAIPVALTARITSKGLTNPHSWPLTNSANLAEASFPFFDGAGYAGSGNLYFGVENGGGYSPGVLTTTFTERPLKLTVAAATVVDPEVADIAVTGNLMVIAQPFNQIAVFRIKKNGSLKLLSTTTIDDQGEGLFSLSIFPNTR
jgi:6-phosphogluconolactonase (cycloisomerase 2 family)